MTAVVKYEDELENMRHDHWNRVIKAYNKEETQTRATTKDVVNAGSLIRCAEKEDFLSIHTTNPIFPTSASI